MKIKVMGIEWVVRATCKWMKTKGDLGELAGRDLYVVEKSG
jgi:hypothetical protein